MPERLSALLDDELSPAELEALIDDLDAAGNGRKLARYGLIGECVRGSATVPRAVDLCERISVALGPDAAGGSAPEAPPRRSRARRTWLPLAAAAGLAGLAVALVPGLRHEVAPVAATKVQARATPPAPAPAAATRNPGLPPERLTSYLVYHGPYTGMLSAKVVDSHIVSVGQPLQAAALRDPSRP